MEILAQKLQNKISFAENVALLYFMLYVIRTLHKVRKFLLAIQHKKTIEGYFTGPLLHRSITI